MSEPVPDTIEVLDAGKPIAYGFEDLLRYHGHHSPGGVAHTFKVLQRVMALPAEQVYDAG